MVSNHNSIDWIWLDWNGSTPINIYFFIVGIFLWFSVGVLWKDRAIMIVHIGAFISIIIGFFLVQVKF